MAPGDKHTNKKTTRTEKHDLLCRGNKKIQAEDRVFADKYAATHFNWIVTDVCRLSFRKILLILFGDLFLHHSNALILESELVAIS